MPRKLVLIVIDGMTPAAFERAVESGAPALSFLAEHGEYRRATSVFPSLTPVCITSIATGAGPGVHHIPSLVWWNRQERRIVEYGSSLPALRAAGLSQSLLHTIFNMNRRPLPPDPTTIYQAPQDPRPLAAAAGAALLEAAGGPDEFLERSAVVLLSDHGQTPVEQAARLEEPLADVAHEIIVAASNRAGQVYLLPGARVEAGELARRLDRF